MILRLKTRESWSPPGLQIAKLIFTKTKPERPSRPQAEGRSCVQSTALRPKGRFAFEWALRRPTRHRRKHRTAPDKATRESDPARAQRGKRTAPPPTRHSTAQGQVDG